MAPAPLPEVSGVECAPCQKELCMKLYLHQVVAPKPNQQTVLSPNKDGLFGTTIVHNWGILDAPDFKSKVVGHAQGIHVMADQPSVGWYTSFNIVFQDGSFKGSTLQVMGVITPVGEWSIVGGTGELTMARGTIKYKVILENAGVESIRELDIDLFYTPKAPPVVNGATVDTSGA